MSRYISWLNTVGLYSAHLSRFTQPRTHLAHTIPVLNSEGSWARRIRYLGSRSRSCNFAPTSLCSNSSHKSENLYMLGSYPDHWSTCLMFRYSVKSRLGLELSPRCRCCSQTVSHFLGIWSSACYHSRSTERLFSEPRRERTALLISTFIKL